MRLFANDSIKKAVRDFLGRLFFLPCRAFFALRGFFFLRGRSEALKRFLSALRCCFWFGVAVCVLLFVLLCSVTAQILLVTAFYGIGSMFIYPKIKTALNGFILPYTAISIFYHFLPL